jgi:hypothetical protein
MRTEPAEIDVWAIVGAQIAVKSASTARDNKYRGSFILLEEPFYVESNSCSAGKRLPVKPSLNHIVG